MNKEIRKLSRKDLLEIVLEQTKRIEELESKLDILEKELSLKKINIMNSGSIAEASLKISEIFKSVDEAAEIYTKNVKNLARKEAYVIRNKIIQETKNRCKKQEELFNKKLKEKVNV